jgi:hypothetical protein
LVTVTDHGPPNAYGVATTLFVPGGLTVTSAPGATIHSGTLRWADPSVPFATKTVYPVTFKVGAHTHATVGIGGVSEGDRYDADLINNDAIAALQLGPDAT